jgi:hypothetical protein
VSASRLHDLSCVIHIHSTYSDGTATVPEIAEAAREAGRDVALLTDHDSLGALHGGWEGWHEEVLVLVGHEVSARGGHFLAFGIDREINHYRIAADEIPAAVQAAGGFSFAAHPFPHDSRLSRLMAAPHPTRRLLDPALAGVELWNFVSDTVGRWHNPLEPIRFLRDPDGATHHPPPTHLEAWDRLSAQRRSVAIGSIDAHQSGIRFRGRVRTPTPNRTWFGLLGTHVLTDDALAGDLERDRGLLYGALRAGRCYISRDSIADPRGFEFWAESGGGRVEMGAEAQAGPGWTLRARLPRRAELRLMRDGAEVAAAEADALEHGADAPGVYRLEAQVRTAGTARTWILSNPIHLREARVR